MTPKTPPGDQESILCPESVSTRQLPANLDPGDLALFEHELTRAIPVSRLRELHDVRVTADGVLFQGLRVLPESFPFPDRYEEWRRRYWLRSLVKNYLLQTSTRLDGDAVWIVDTWSGSYFHWFADALARLYVVRDRLNEWTVLLPHALQAMAFVEASLAPFGVRRVRYVAPTEFLICPHLFTPTHLAPSGHYNDSVLRAVRQVLVDAYAGPTPAGGEERVYISRARAGKRRVSNEGDVVDLLRGLGFRVLYAESCSFKEQVHLAARTRFLVSNHGAGLTNMLFMRPGRTVFELRHRRGAAQSCYFTMASALGLNYFYQVCGSAGADDDPHVGDIEVDLGRLDVEVRRMLAA